MESTTAEQVSIPTGSENLQTDPATKIGLSTASNWRYSIVLLY
jgi:hypothetical protein